MTSFNNIRIISRAAMTLALMLLTTATAWALDPLNVFNYTFATGSDNEGEYYVVDGTEALDALATYVNGGNNASGMRFKQTADITYTHTTDWNDANSEENNFTAIGNGYYFSGIFDGAGHTISGIRIYKSGQYETGNNCQALFSYIYGATVKNVILADARITGFLECGGIAGRVEYGGRIENCHALSTVTIHAVQNDASYHGGIVGYLHTSSDVTVVEGCTSAASITTTVSSSENYGGIVGSVSPNCTVSDCIYFGSTVEGSSNVGAIAGYIKGTVSNCYYTNTTLASSIGYEYSGSTFEDVRLATSDDFAVSGDTYTIGSAAGWSIFCGALYHNNTYNRFSGKTVNLGNDITVSSMAGSEYHDFCGTFDGGGNTLTFNYGSSTTPNSDQYTAPFRYVSNTKPVGSNTDSPVTIRNLHVAGDIYTTAKCAAGLIARQWGTVNIENCRSSIVVHSNVTNDDNDGTHSGFVSVQQSGTLSFTGCTFDGKLLTDATNVTTKCGGFVGYRSGSTGVTASVTNCLYAPADLADGETEAVGNSATFVRNGNANDITNSYYVTALGTVQGKQARSVTAGTKVTVALSGTATQYTTSGITAYKDGNTQKPGLLYNGTIYAGSGDNVSLTLSHTAVPTGYDFGYTVSGGSLSGNDTDGYTLTMPDADVTVTAFHSSGTTVSVSYIDENGETQTAQAIALDGTEKVDETYGCIELSGSAYYVGTDITYNTDCHIKFTNDATLILGDGASMTITTMTENYLSPYSIYSEDNLTICGQALGTGKLNVTNNVTDEFGIYSDYENENVSITINGGNVTATGDSNGITAYGITINGGNITTTGDTGSGISAGRGGITINGGTVTATGNNSNGGGLYTFNYGNITINGGTVTATGNNSYGISAESIVTLGWTNATDRIYASSYGGANVKITKLFTDGTITYLGDPDSDYWYDEPGTIAGKTLSPCLQLADNADNGATIDGFSGKAIAVQLQGRTLYKDGAWNTLCLPFSVTAAQMAETTHPLYGATIKELDATGTYDTDKQTGFDATDGTLYLYFKDATTIEAGKPYIVKWATTGSNIENPVFSGVTVSSTAPTGVTLTDGKYIVCAENSGLNTVQFIGSYSPVALTPDDMSNLFLSTSTKSGNTVSTLYYPNAANNQDGNYYVNAFRGYFHVDLGNAKAVRGFNLNFGEEGEKTGIIELKNSRMEDMKSADAWYSLDGRKLSGKPTKKGVYINHGRKIVVK